LTGGLLDESSAGNGLPVAFKDQGEVIGDRRDHAPRQGWYRSQIVG
jgi:hypothetical protein